MSRANPRYRRVNPSLQPVGTINGVVLYQIQGSIEGQMTLNSFYYASTVPAPTPTQLTTLIGSIRTNLFTAYKNCLSSDWVCVREQLKVVHRNDIATLTSLTSAGTVGGRAAGHEPTEIAIVVLRGTATKGQHGRGRFSLPAVSTSDITASQISSATLTTALNTLNTGVLASASDGGNVWLPVIAQRATTSPRLAVGTAPLTYSVASAILGTIRRRKLGRGK